MIAQFHVIWISFLLAILSGVNAIFFQNVPLAQNLLIGMMASFIVSGIISIPIQIATRNLFLHEFKKRVITVYDLLELQQTYLLTHKNNGGLRNISLSSSIIIGKSQELRQSVISYSRDFFDCKYSYPFFGKLHWIEINKIIHIFYNEIDHIMLICNQIESLWSACQVYDLETKLRDALIDRYGDNPAKYREFNNEKKIMEIEEKHDKLLNELTSALLKQNNINKNILYDFIKNVDGKKILKRFLDVQSQIEEGRVKTEKIR